MGCTLLCLHQLGIGPTLLDASHQDLSYLAFIDDTTGQVPVPEKGPFGSVWGTAPLWWRPESRMLPWQVHRAQMYLWG